MKYFYMLVGLHLGKQSNANVLCSRVCGCGTVFKDYFGPSEGALLQAFLMLGTIRKAKRFRL